MIVTFFLVKIINGKLIFCTESIKDQFYSSLLFNSYTNLKNL